MLARIAGESYHLYPACSGDTKRKAQKGFAFSPDTYLQNELEASFIYEDTPDQVKATADVKKDMEKSYPMDRLICGDVGFGKTEVAVRAAFKAVADGKQVAVLVPTTILALQHFRTFSEPSKSIQFLICWTVFTVASQHNLPNTHTPKSRDRTYQFKFQMMTSL